MKTTTLRLPLLALATVGLALAAPATPAPAPTPPAPACPNARLTTVTETKTLSPGGRAATQRIESTRRLTCTACDVPMTVLRPSGHNGRGAMAPVTISGTHDCSRGCAR